jgi:hypothetical protein
MPTSVCCWGVGARHPYVGDRQQGADVLQSADACCLGADVVPCWHVTDIPRLAACAQRYLAAVRRRSEKSDFL